MLSAVRNSFLIILRRRALREGLGANSKHDYSTQLASTSVNSAASNPFVFTRLANRTIVRIQGKDVYSFLHSLLTQDVQ